MDPTQPPSSETPGPRSASPAHNDPEPAPEPARPRTADPGTDETVKETIESIVIAFILAFVFRAFIVEPFIIPTGSMAPTLLGAHLQHHCPSCGYRFDTGVDPETDPEGSALPEPRLFNCPMCNYGVTAKIGTRVRSGDRILVDKFSYHLTDPARWDVIVFKAPEGSPIGGEPAPRTNFIKRLIGLPGERVALLDGNVYVAPAGTNDFVIARKTDPQTNRHWQSIQRAVWQPVYHSEYVPIQSGSADGPGRDKRHVWRVPWQQESGEWELGSQRNPRRVYRFAGGKGVIRFESQGGVGTISHDKQNARYPYNYNRSSGSLNDPHPIEDIRLACAATIGEGNARISLSTTARLDRPDLGIETLTATIDSAGSVKLTATSDDATTRELGYEQQITPLEPGIATDIELWLVDDEASVWINRERVLVQRFELSAKQIAERPEQAMTPEIRIAIDSDNEVELRRVELDRDIYYFANRYRYAGFSRGEARRIDGKIRVGPNPLDLRKSAPDHDAELFVLGDNQPASKDGRDWTDVDGWVRVRYFDGEERPGVVPRSLLVGRAFMVYYPAPHGVSPRAKGVFPDFGRMRFVH